MDGECFINVLLFFVSLWWVSIIRVKSENCEIFYWIRRCSSRYGLLG